MINQFPKNAPLRPGIYRFYDRKRRVLYVGKAANLRNRLRSYFNSKLKEAKVEAMLQEAASVDWQITGSEIEALILEAQLIKKYKTPFNILMRDGKQYASVGITREDFPRIFVTRQRPQEIKTSRGLLKVKYIGPFTDANSLKLVIAYLHKVFPFCSCKQLHSRPCLNYQIGKCPGYCCLRTDDNKDKNKKIYNKNVSIITDLLAGRKEKIIKDLRKEMRAAAAAGDFETGAKLEHELNGLKRVFENARVLREIEGRDTAIFGLQKTFHLPAPPRRIEAYDISNIQGLYATGAMIVFANGQPDKNEYRRFKIKRENSPNDVAMLKEMLARRFLRNDWPAPDLLLVDGGKGQLNAAADALSHHAPSSTKSLPILAIAKGKSEIYSTTLARPIPISKLADEEKNLILHLDAEAHRFAISYYRKLHKIN